MSAHTAGPWKVIPSPHGAKYKCVQLGSDDTYTTLEMVPADARLIAAAPDLLEALHMLYRDTASYIEVNRLGPVHHNQSMQLAVAALAKAGL